MAVDVSICVDDLPVARPNRVRASEEGRPFVFVYIGDAFRVWGEKPAAFRQLAQALTEAADALEAWVPPGVPT